MNKITIIGSGSVGSTIAYTLSVQGICSEIVLIDIAHEKAMGEALDIRQGLPFCNPCSVYAGTYEDAKDSDIVIITSGVARKPGQTRLELAQTNINVLRSIMPQITKNAPDSIYLLVSNPVDILTYVFCKESGIPENRIIGSGTILDTARLRSRLSEYYSISQKNVHAYVFGEHGDSSFVPWSLANVSNVPVGNCDESFGQRSDMLPSLDLEEVENYVRKTAGVVIERKGATFYAVSVSVCYICRCILSGIDTTMTISTMMHGQYGIEDVCLSTLAIVGSTGIRGMVNLPMTNDEVEKLKLSANKLKEIIDGTDIKK
jgi:L-lactate dehydrogenase